MFRIINRFIISKHLSRLSNGSLKSHKYYSSEPPDKVLSVRLKSPSDRKPEELETGSSDTFYRRTASELNLFGPHDLRAPLNGNIGLGSEAILFEAKTLVNIIRKTTSIERINNLSQKGLNSNAIDIESLDTGSDEKRFQKLFRILKYQKLFPQEMSSATESTDFMAFNAHDLPFKVIKKFEALFTTSNRSKFNNGLTALTLTKKTANDMSGYSQEVELERETFFEEFITDAKNICVELQKSGFWADFIDPYSGQPFLV